MKISVPLTEKDFINVQFFMLENLFGWVRKNNSNMKKLFFIVFMFLGIINVLNYSSITNVIIGIMCFCVAFFYGNFNRYIYTKSFKKTFDLMKDEGSQQISIDSENLKFSMPNIFSEMKTKDILCFWETNDYFHIQVRKLAVLYIPKELLENVDEVKKEFRGYAASYNIEYKELK